MTWDESLVTLVVLAVLICVVNFTFVILVYHRGSLGRLQNALLFSLGCSDFCAGGFAIPFIVVCTLSPVPDDCGFCITSYLFNRFVAMLSFLHLIAVIYERYLKIVHPFWFQSHEYTLLRSGRVVVGLWLASVLIACVPLTFWPLTTPCLPDETLERNLRYFDNACLALYILLIVLVVYAFVRIFLVVRMHLLDINTTAVQLSASLDNVLSQQESAGSHAMDDNLNCVPKKANRFQSESELSYASTRSTRRSVLLKEARVVIRFAVMLLIFILGWGIYFTVSFLVVRGKEVSLLLLQVIGVVRFVSPLIDAWILTVNNKEFTLCYKCCRDCRRKYQRCFLVKDTPASAENSQTVQIRIEDGCSVDHVSSM